jgi:S1-C subfamily serine protease
MASLLEWKVPAAAQPRAQDYGYDLERALSSVIGLHAIIPSDAFTADTLGVERAGTGVLIDDGLVLTIGYLITEAETIWLHLGDGRVVEGHALAYDQETGFGLVQALGRIELPTLPIGSSDKVEVGERAVAGARARWPRASPPSRNSPDTGNTCWTRRSSPIRPIPTGAAPR